MKNRILLIGKRKKILKRISRALEAESYETLWVNSIRNISSFFSNGNYDLVAFGRGILRFDKEWLKDEFRKQNPAILFVDGLAPIPGLLIAQVNYAFAVQSGMALGFSLFPFEKTNHGLNMNFEIAHSASISISLYRLDFLYRVKQETISFGQIKKGRHSIAVSSKLFGKDVPDFIVARNKHVVLGVQTFVLKDK